MGAWGTVDPPLPPVPPLFDYNIDGVRVLVEELGGMYMGYREAWPGAETTSATLGKGRERWAVHLPPGLPGAPLC